MNQSETTNNDNKQLRELSLNTNKEDIIKELPIKCFANTKRVKAETLLYNVSRSININDI